MYSYEAVANEVQAFIDRSPWGTQKRLATAAGKTETEFSKCLAGARRFREEHWGAIAVEAGAAKGWPYITWSEAQALAAFRSMAKKVDEETGGD